MFNRLNRFTSRKYYSGPNSNFPKNPKDNDIYSAWLSGLLAAIFGSSLYIDNKKEYSQDEKNSRIVVYGLT
jgi:hypothetical protein